MTDTTHPSAGIYSRTRLRRIFHGAVLQLLLTFSATAANGAFYVAPDGSDANPGSIVQPFKTIGKALSVATPGDTVHVRAGTYNELISFPIAGTAAGRITLKAYNNEAVTLLQTGRVMNIGQPYISVENMILDGGWGNSDIVRVTSAADYLVFRGMEIRNTRHDAIDISAPAGVLIDNCRIYNAINVSGGTRVDAHGIVTGGVRDFTVRNSEIYYVSGDAIQLQYGGWNNVLVENSLLWNGPLPTARGGANAGDNPGEDGIDTKFYPADGRGKLTVRNSTVHGWGKGGNPLYASSAGFNIKHNVEVVLAGVTAYDNHYAFRLRGPGSKGGAWVTLKNAVVHDSTIGVRYEDAIENLHIYNTTFGNGLGSQFQSAGGAGAGFDVRNNLFLGQRPTEAIDTSNIAVTASAFVDAANDDYHLSQTSPAIDSGTVIAEVATDKDGITRPQGSAYDAGAYEYSGGSLVIDIRANDSNGPITINSGEPLRISIAMTAGDQTGQAADWWIVIKTPFGFIPHYLPLSLFDLAPLTLLDSAGLPAGNYTFYFAVDDNRDGRFDGHHLDSVEVTIQ